MLCSPGHQVERVKKNASLTDDERSQLIREKREAIVKPLVHTIERLSDITRKPAETRHEQWFQETYSHLIERGLHQLNHPVKDDDLVSDWQPFKQVWDFLLLNAYYVLTGVYVLP